MAKGRRADERTRSYGRAHSMVFTRDGKSTAGAAGHQSGSWRRGVRLSAGTLRMRQIDAAEHHGRISVARPAERSGSTAKWYAGPIRAASLSSRSAASFPG